MFAVIFSGGKQYRVAEGQTVKLETLPAEVGETIEFDRVLMVANDKDVQIGAPYLKAKVSAQVIEHGRGDKIRIVKHRRRKHYHKEMGHRQNFTAVKITEIKL